MAAGLSFSASGAFYTSETLQIRRQLQEEERQHLRQPTLHSSSASEVAGDEQVQSTADDVATEKDSCYTPGLPRWTYRNLYAASISFMFIFSAFLGLQGLQSSLNEEIGIASLSILYGFSFLIGFVTTAIVRLLSTKYALLFGYICYTIYTVTNFYPEFYSLIPSSVLLGIGTGLVWAAVSTHFGVTALIFAMSPNVGESLDAIITKFTGIFFFTFQMAQILGNIVSSLVLFPYDSVSDGNTTLGQLGDTCDNTEAQNVTPTQLYILLSVYLVFDGIGILILLVFVSKIPQEVNSKTKSVVRMKSRCRRYCSEPFIDVMKVLISWKMLLLGPLSLYNGAQLSFAFSSYTANVVSACVGVSKVGFTLIVLGFFSAITSVIYGRVVKYIHRVLLGHTAAVINLFFLLFLQFYPLQPSYALVFLFAIFWGTAGGIWNTLTGSLVGILFPNHQDSAYSAFRIWMSLGFAIGFAITELKSFSNRIWTMIVILLASFACYIVLEVFIGKFGRKKCCNKDLGVFDGPKAKYDQLSKNNEDLTEEMLNVHVGDIESSSHMMRNSYNESHNYVPPLTISRAATFCAGGYESDTESRVPTVSVLVLTTDGTASDVGEEVAAVPSSNVTVVDESDQENIAEQKKRLLQSAVF